MKHQITKTIVSISTLLIVSSLPITAYAQETGITNKIINRINTESEGKTSSFAGQIKESTIADRKTRADKAIDNRISSLNNLLTKITTAKRLSDSEKATLIAQVQSYISNLTELKTKIDGDTDSTTLKTDIQSIIDDYRVYAFFMPQMELLSVGNSILTTTQKIASISPQLQAIIQNTKSQGKDTTAMETAFSDMQSKVSDANTQIQNAITAITGLTPTGFPGNKTTLQTARSYIVTARQDLETAIKDIRIITQNRSEIKNPKNQSASNSASNTNQ